MYSYRSGKAFRAPLCTPPTRVLSHPEEKKLVSSHKRLVHDLNSKEPVALLFAEPFHFEDDKDKTAFIRLFIDHQKNLSSDYSKESRDGLETPTRVDFARQNGIKSPGTSGLQPAFAMIPICNRPLIDYVLEFLIINEIRKIFVVSFDSFDVVNTHLTEYWFPDALRRKQSQGEEFEKSCGVQIANSDEDESSEEDSEDDYTQNKIYFTPKGTMDTATINIGSGPLFTIYSVCGGEGVKTLSDAFRFVHDKNIIPEENFIYIPLTTITNMTGLKQIYRNHLIRSNPLIYNKDLLEAKKNSNFDLGIKLLTTSVVMPDSRSLRHTWDRIMDQVLNDNVEKRMRLYADEQLKRAPDELKTQTPSSIPQFQYNSLTDAFDSQDPNSPFYDDVLGDPPAVRDMRPFIATTAGLSIDVLRTRQPRQRSAAVEAAAAAFPESLASIPKRLMPSDIFETSTPKTRLPGSADEGKKYEKPYHHRCTFAFDSDSGIVLGFKWWRDEQANNRLPDTISSMRSNILRTANAISEVRRRTVQHSATSPTAPLPANADTDFSTLIGNGVVDCNTFESRGSARGAKATHYQRSSFDTFSVPISKKMRVQVRSDLAVVGIHICNIAVLEIFRSNPFMTSFYSLFEDIISKKDIDNSRFAIDTPMNAQKSLQDYFGTKTQVSQRCHSNYGDSVSLEVSSPRSFPGSTRAHASKFFTTASNGAQTAVIGLSEVALADFEFYDNKHTLEYADINSGFAFITVHNLESYLTANNAIAARMLYPMIPESNFNVRLCNSRRRYGGGSGEFGFRAVPFRYRKYNCTNYPYVVVAECERDASPAIREGSRSVLNSNKASCMKYSSAFQGGTYGYCVFGSNSFVQEGNTVVNCIFGNNVEIYGTDSLLVNCVLHDNVRIGPGVYLKDCVVLYGVHIHLPPNIVRAAAVNMAAVQTPRLVQPGEAVKRTAEGSCSATPLGENANRGSWSRISERYPRFLRTQSSYSVTTHQPMINLPLPFSLSEDTTIPTLVGVGMATTKSPPSISTSPLADSRTMSISPLFPAACPSAGRQGGRFLTLNRCYVAVWPPLQLLSAASVADCGVGSRSANVVVETEFFNRYFFEEPVNKLSRQMKSAAEQCIRRRENEEDGNHDDDVSVVSDGEAELASVPDGGEQFTKRLAEAITVIRTTEGEICRPIGRQDRVAISELLPVSSCMPTSILLRSDEIFTDSATAVDETESHFCISADPLRLRRARSALRAEVVNALAIAEDILNREKAEKLIKETFDGREDSNDAGKQANATSMDSSAGNVDLGDLSTEKEATRVLLHSAFKGIAFSVKQQRLTFQLTNNQTVALLVELIILLLEERLGAKKEAVIRQLQSRNSSGRNSGVTSIMKNTAGSDIVPQRQELVKVSIGEAQVVDSTHLHKAMDSNILPTVTSEKKLDAAFEVPEFRSEIQLCLELAAKCLVGLNTTLFREMLETINMQRMKQKLKELSSGYPVRQADSVDNILDNISPLIDGLVLGLSRTLILRRRVRTLLALLYSNADDELFQQYGYCLVSAESIFAYDQYVKCLENDVRDYGSDDCDSEDILRMKLWDDSVKLFVNQIRESLEEEEESESESEHE